MFKFISFIKEIHKYDKGEIHQISKFCIVGGDSRFVGMKIKKKTHNVMEKVTKCHKIYLIECIKNKLRNSQVDFNIFKDYL